MDLKSFLGFLNYFRICKSICGSNNNIVLRFAMFFRFDRLIKNDFQKTVQFGIFFLDLRNIVPFRFPYLLLSAGYINWSQFFCLLRGLYQGKTERK